MNCNSLISGVIVNIDRIARIVDDCVHCKMKQRKTLPTKPRICTKLYQNNLKSIAERNQFETSTHSNRITSNQLDFENG